MPIALPNSIVALDASNSSSYALQCSGGVGACPSDGTEWAFGENDRGQLGNGTTAGSTKTPLTVRFPGGVNIVSMGEANDSGFAVDSTGQGWAWGANLGQLCVGDSASVYSQKTPARVEGITDATQVQGGNSHALWLLSNGTVKQCDKASPSPTLVPGLADIVQISAGNESSGALDSSGHVYMWGSNNLGQIGIDSIANYVYRPELVNLPGPAVQLSAGGDHPNNGHALVLLANNQVYAWGKGGSWQLGDGSRSNQIAPVSVNLPSGVTFTYVASGGQQSFAIDTSGRLWHWGNGSKRLRVVDQGVTIVSATAGNILDRH